MASSEVRCNFAPLRERNDTVCASRYRGPAACLAALMAVVGCSVDPDAEGSPNANAPPTAAADDDPVAHTEHTESALRRVPASRSRRIAVVGAGASGLTAAATLKELGYENVTVFEKEARVGGKVYSRRIGGTVTELGAILASPDYTLVLGLANQHHVPYVLYRGTRTFVDAWGVAQSPENFLRSRYGTLQIAAATLRYASALSEFAAVDQPGLDLVPVQTDLYLPFDAFAAKHRFTPVAELVRAPMVGFGYGYFENAPALYYMRLVDWLVKPSLLRGPVEAPGYTFPTGYQSIWEGVAEDLDVRLDAEVTSIARPSPSGAGVRLTVKGAQTFDFDEVIVSAPLHRVASFMTLGPEESALFSQVQSLRYRATAFTASGLRTGEALFFQGNAVPSRIDHVVAWQNAGPQRPFVAYQIARFGASSAELTSLLHAAVGSRGGAVDTISDQEDWDYFPHVSTSALQDGFYYRVAALQGDRHTFYVGSTLAFETVEHAARQARALVLRHFPVPRLP